MKTAKKAKKLSKKVEFGRNIFGEKCIAKSNFITKETGLMDYLKMLDDIDAHTGMFPIEYTTYFSEEFTDEEIRELVHRASLMRALCSKRGIDLTLLATDDGIQINPKCHESIRFPLANIQ